MPTTVEATVNVAGPDPEVKYNHFDLAPRSFMINPQEGAWDERAGFQNTGDVPLTVEVGNVVVETGPEDTDPDDDVVVNDGPRLEVAGQLGGATEVVQPGQSAKVLTQILNNQAMGEPSIPVKVKYDITVRNPDGDEINPDGTVI